MAHTSFSKKVTACAGSPACRISALLLAGAVVLITVGIVVRGLMGYAQYYGSSGGMGGMGGMGGHPMPSYSPPAMVAASDVTVKEQCFDAAGKKLAATDPHPAEYYVKNGRWDGYFSVTKNAFVEKKDLKPSEEYVIYWRRNKKSAFDQTVYVKGNTHGAPDWFASYGAAGTCKADGITTFPLEKEMRCYRNEPGNQMWIGWLSGQGLGMKDKPKHIVKGAITLEADIRCSGAEIGGWGWIIPPKEVQDEVPVVQQSSVPSSAAKKTTLTGKQNRASLLNLSAEEESAEDVAPEKPAPKKSAPLIRLLKKKQ